MDKIFCSLRFSVIPRIANHTEYANKKTIYPPILLAIKLSIPHPQTLITMLCWRWRPSFFESTHLCQNPLTNLNPLAKVFRTKIHLPKPSTKYWNPKIAKFRRLPRSHSIESIQNDIFESILTCLFCLFLPCQCAVDDPEFGQTFYTPREYWRNRFDQSRDRKSLFYYKCSINVIRGVGCPGMKIAESRVCSCSFTRCKKKIRLPSEFYFIVVTKFCKGSPRLPQALHPLSPVSNFTLANVSCPFTKHWQNVYFNRHHFLLRR